MFLRQRCSYIFLQATRLPFTTNAAILLHDMLRGPVKAWSQEH